MDVSMSASFSSYVVDLVLKKKILYKTYFLFFFSLSSVWITFKDTLWFFELDDETRQDMTRTRKCFNETERKKCVLIMDECVSKSESMCARFVWKMRSSLPFRHVNSICVNFIFLLLEMKLLVIWNNFFYLFLAVGIMREFFSLLIYCCCCYYCYFHWNRMIGDCKSKRVTTM